jgi:hypothetical protein
MIRTEGGVVGSNDPPATFRFSDNKLVGQGRFLR